MPAREDFIARVRRRLSVGADQDVAIGDALDDAISYFLRNFKFLRGYRYIEMPLPAGERLVRLPPDVGVIKFSRLVSEGRYWPIHGLPVLDKGEVEGWPTHYFRDGQSQLWLQGTTPSAVSLELFYKSLVGFGGPIAGRAADWLLESYRDALYYRVLLTAAPEVRKSQMVPIYTALWQDVERGIHIQQDDEEHANTDTRMTYRPADYRESDYPTDPLWVSKYPGGWDNV